MTTLIHATIEAIFALAIGGAQIASAQFALSRNGRQLAYNSPFTLQAPQAGVAARRLNGHEFLRPRPVLLLASAPVRLDGEISFGQLFSPISSTGGFGGAYDGTRWPEDYLKRKRSDELRGDASLSLQPAPEPMPPAPRPGVVQAEPFHEQSNFQGEYIDPSLLATLRRFEQSRGWQIGGGGLFSFGWNHSSRLMVHCGPSFKSPREAFEGERCFGVLLRFDLGRRKPAH